MSKHSLYQNSIENKIVEIYSPYCKMEKRKLKILTIREKVKIISQIDGGKRKIDVAREFNIPPSTLTAILKKKEKILLKSRTSENLNIKKIRNTTHQQLEEAVMLFIDQSRSLNIPLTGAIIQQKAKIYADKLGVINFKASDGWLSKLKKRHNIVLKIMSGESHDVNMDAVNEWTETLPNLLKDFEPEDIFNMDETGLFFKCLPTKTLTYKNEKCYGGKFRKERVTVLIGANSTGTEKLKLMVIGKSKSPRCFKNIRSLPIIYRSNRRAWMTGEIFERYMLELDEKFTVENRKVLFFVDNCPAHPKSVVPKLKAITLLYFPPNMTSHVQPMDSGVIKNLKKHYRERLVMSKLEDMEASRTGTSITLLDAIKHLVEAWNDVTPSTIKNCFRHVQIKEQWTENDNVPLADIANEIENEAINEESFNQIWKRLAEILEFDTSFDQYINVDENLVHEPFLADEEIISFITQTEENNVVEGMEDHSSNSVPLKSPSLDEKNNALSVIYNLLLTSSSVPDVIFESF